MTRVYLDWNTFSDLKRDAFHDLRDFFYNSKRFLQLPFSPSHFSDLMKSYIPGNDKFDADLQTLNDLCDNHLIMWDEDVVAPKLATPKEYFSGLDKELFGKVNLDLEKALETLDDAGNEYGLPSVGAMLKDLFKATPSGIEPSEDEIFKMVFPNLKENSTMWDLMGSLSPFSNNLFSDRDFYKDFRKKIGDKGLRVSQNSGNWSEEEVVNEIDKLLDSLDTDMDFIQFVESPFRAREKQITRFEFFTTAYLMLDIIGYKSDSLKKSTDNMGNIQTDAEHGLYAAHCDFFICRDKNLRIKAGVLFKKLGITTIILKPEEALRVLKSSTHEFSLDKLTVPEITAELNQFVNSSYHLSTRHAGENNQLTIDSLFLPKRYFNFFNYIDYCVDYDNYTLYIKLMNEYRGYNNFTFYSEVKLLIENLVARFGEVSSIGLENLKEDFMSDNPKNQIYWNFEGGTINLLKGKNKIPEIAFTYGLDKEIIDTRKEEVQAEKRMNNIDN